MFDFIKIENKFIITFISFTFISFIGIIDYYSGSEISLLLGYLIPILIVSTYKNSEKTLLFINAFFAAFIWFLVNFYTIEYSNLFNPIWNAFVRFAVFIIIGLLVLSLKEKYKNVIKLNEELKLLNNEKNNFIGMAAHDLRNPIGAIYSFSELLLEDYSEKIDEKGINILTHIKNLSNNSLELLKNLLDVSKIESGTINLISTKNNYIEFITKHLYFNLLIARKKNISIKFETAEKELSFIYDEHYLSEVINNLLTNAIKFSYENSEILIKVSKTSNNTIITEIIDQGQGIAVDEQNKLFNYFQKTSTLPTNGESSTGLGLAIAKKIILQHKGTIGVISELKKGSNFYFELPNK